jgi:hypothetical protein
MEPFQTRPRPADPWGADPSRETSILLPSRGHDYTLHAAKSFNRASPIHTLKPASARRAAGEPAGRPGPSRGIGSPLC